MRFQHEDYTVGWIAALHVELAAAQSMLDDTHPQLSAMIGDDNTYTFGRIGEHNVVIAGLSAGTYGVTSAAVVASNMLRSFPNVKFGLMVGIGGGVPMPHDIRLGDIVVGIPEGTNGGVLQYDFGKAIQEQRFKLTGSLNKPPAVLSRAVTELRAKELIRGYCFDDYYEHAMNKNPRMRRSFERPSSDVLFEPDCVHSGSSTDCKDCHPLLVSRKQRKGTKPKVFYGTIGSANAVMKDAVLRDRLAETTGIICFEMEAAGLMDNFPSIAIRGICDYADSHKNKEWQPYASLVAAAYAKELLLSIAGKATREVPRQDGELEEATSRIIEDQRKNEECLRALRKTDPRADKTRHDAEKRSAWRQSDLRETLLGNSNYIRDWKNSHNSTILLLTGHDSSGKSWLLSTMLDRALADDSGEFTIAYAFSLGSTSLDNTAVTVLRGLMFMMVRQQPSLITHIREEYDSAGRSLFEDANAWFALSEIFKKMLDNPLARDIIFAIRSLNECKDAEKLLQLITQSACSMGTRWILTNPAWPSLEQHLQNMTPGTKLSVEFKEPVSRVSMWYCSFTPPDPPRVRSTPAWSHSLTRTFRVVQGGHVEDENGHPVGQVVEGDAEKLLGYYVSENGEIVQNRTIIGRATMYYR